MGAPGLGFKSSIQIGLESAFGTAVAATRKLDAISFSVTPVIGVIRDSSLTNNASRKALYQGGQLYRFTIKQRLDYTGLLLLWDSVFGTGTFGTAGGATTGSNPYSHVYVEKSLLNSYSLEFIEGDVPSGKCTRLYGAKFSGMKVTGQAGTGDNAILQVEWSGLAKSITTNFTPTAALSAVTANPVLYHEASTVDDGTADSSSDIRVRSFELTLDNKLAEDRFYLSAIGIDEPVRNDFLEVKWKFTKEYQTKTLADAAIAFTSGSPKLVFGSTTSKRVTLESGTAYLTSYGHPVNGPGIIEQSAEWEAVYNSSDTSALKVTVEDTAATIS